MQAVLLGGSNSVLSHALSCGLEQQLEVANLALGATTCVQNLCEVVRNEERVRNAELIVTESNVNDVGCLKYFGRDIRFVENSIDLFYRELFRLNPNVVVLILPVKANPFETRDIIKCINERHLRNADLYGFMTLEIDKIFESNGPDEADLLMLDARHPIHSYMYHLGSNIGRYARENRRALADHRTVHSEQVRLSRSPLSFLRAEDFEHCKRTRKSNSRFSEDVILLEGDVSVPSEAIGRTLLGVLSWSDNFSCMRLSNGDEIFIKPFGDLYSFNEFVAQPVIKLGCLVGSFYGDMQDTTEESIHLTRRSAGELADEWEIGSGNLQFSAPVGLVGFLLTDGSVGGELLNRPLGRKDVSSLAPSPEPYRRTIDNYVKRKRLISVSNAVLNRIIDSAKVLAEHDVEEARKLLKVALQIDPNSSRGRAVAKIIKVKMASHTGVR
ncbi:hypothetical protein [Altererythrobacter sp. B11]|uniref:hypothetical protein n=1 Tax=Altererythrobacter sp. B11 TaxID=2060312 RepID=UPI000E5A5380|nr:hypothetical protein [Altererythrobacter sp. B11]